MQKKTHLMLLRSSARLQNMQEPTVSINGVSLKQSIEKKESLLGIEIQCDLKWSSQASTLCSRLKTRLAILEKLKYIMTNSSKKNIVQGMFNSVLCYCLPLFGGCSKYSLDNLQSLQNKAVRIVLNLPKRSNREKMFDEIGWLTVRQMVVYHTLLTVHSIRISKQPEYLSKLLLNENHNGNIIVSNVQLGLLRNSFAFRGAISWNKLPRMIRLEESKTKFKNDVRRWVQEQISRFDD